MPFVTANVLQPLIDVFEQVLLFFHGIVGSWGLSIILLTVTIRTILLPLTFKQFKSMAALQRLAPEMKKLKEKYGDDKQRLNQEMMKFYQEHKVNPFGSCLPLVAQMPVFISLFYMLRKDLKEDICPKIIDAIAPGGKFAGQQLANLNCEQINPGSGSFWFIPDLTAPATGGVLALLLVLYVGSQLASSILMSTTMTDKNQQRIMLALPFLFVFFILRFPAGLLLYWITTNVWTVFQQYFVRRSVGLSVPGRPGSIPNPEPMDFAGMFGKKEDKVAATAGKGGVASKGGTATKGDKPAAKPTKPSNGSAPAARSGPPPTSPRKKKKKTGRRR